MEPEERPSHGDMSEAERASRAVGLGMLLGLVMALAARLTRAASCGRSA